MCGLAVAPDLRLRADEITLDWQFSLRLSDAVGRRPAVGESPRKIKANFLKRNQERKFYEANLICQPYTLPASGNVGVTSAAEAISRSDNTVASPFQTYQLVP